MHPILCTPHSSRPKALLSSSWLQTQVTLASGMDLLFASAPYSLNLNPQVHSSQCKSEPAFLHQHRWSSGLSVKIVPMSPAPSLLQMHGLLVSIEEHRMHSLCKTTAFAIPFAPEPHVFLPPQDSVEICLTFGPVPHHHPLLCLFSASHFICIHSEDNHLSRSMFPIFLSYF